MLVAQVKFLLYSNYGTQRLNLFNRTNSSWGVRKHQTFGLHVELRRFVRHQTNNEPATASI